MNITTYTPDYNGPVAIVYKKGDNLSISKTLQNRLDAYAAKFEESWMELQDGSTTVWAFQLTKELEANERAEKMRLAGNALAGKVNGLGLDRVKLEGPFQAEVCEGAILGNYQFLKFFSDAHKRRNSLVQLLVEDENQNPEPNCCIDKKDSNMPFDNKGNFVVLVVYEQGIAEAQDHTKANHDINLVAKIMIFILFCKKNGIACHI